MDGDSVYNITGVACFICVSEAGAEKEGIGEGLFPGPWVRFTTTTTFGFSFWMANRWYLDFEDGGPHWHNRPFPCIFFFFLRCIIETVLVRAWS